MRALCLCTLVLVACSTEPCKKGTARVEYTVPSGDDVADVLDVTLYVGTGPPQGKTIPRKPGDTSLEIDFSSYPKGQDVTVVLEAHVSGGGVLAAGSAKTTVDGSCFALVIDLMGGTDLGANGGDLAPYGDGGAPIDDFAGQSLPDLALPHADLAFAPQTAPSCTLLAPNCGASLGDSCCASPLVQGGTYYRSRDFATDNMYPSTAHPATVSSFRLDKYQVTVGRFRKFLAAGKGIQSGAPADGAGANPYLPGSGWDATDWDMNLETSTAALEAQLSSCTTTGNMSNSWTNTVGSTEDLPINCVTWFEAFAFCAWDGGFMPTEAEWNYAAAAGDQQRAYPWSNPGASLTISCAYANYEVGSGTDGTKCVNGMAGGLWNVGTAPKGDGYFGQSDLAGNVYEWVLDWNVTYPVPCTNCAILTGGTERIFRGGGLISAPTSLRTGFRAHSVPTTRGTNLGIRCARSL